MKFKSFLVFLTILSCTTTTDITNQLEQSTTSSSSTTLTTIKLEESTTTTDKSNQNIYYGPITCQKISSTGIEISIEIDNPKDKAYSAYFQILDDSKYLSEGYNAGVGNYIDFIISANSDDKFEFKYIHKNIQQPEDLTNQELIDEYGITVLLFVNDKQISRECEYKLDFIKKETVTSTTTTSTTTTSTTTTIPNKIFDEKYLKAWFESFGESNKYYKWGKEVVTLSISGTPNDIQNTAFVEGVEEINVVLENLKLEIVDKDGDIQFFIGNKSEWKNFNELCLTDNTRMSTRFRIYSESLNFAQGIYCGINYEDYKSLTLVENTELSPNYKSCAIYDIKYSLWTLFMGYSRYANYEIYGEGYSTHSNNGEKFCLVELKELDKKLLEIHYDKRNKFTKSIVDGYNNLSNFTVSESDLTNTTDSTSTTSTSLPQTTTTISESDTPSEINYIYGAINIVYDDRVVTDNFTITKGLTGEWRGTVGLDYFFTIDRDWYDTKKWTGAIGQYGERITIQQDPFDTKKWTGTINMEPFNITQDYFESSKYSISGPIETVILLPVLLDN